MKKLKMVETFARPNICNKPEFPHLFQKVEILNNHNLHNFFG